MKFTLFIIFIAISVYSKQVSAHGKEGPLTPNLPPTVLESLKPTVRPPVAHGARQVLTCLPGYVLEDGVCVKPVEEPAGLACIGGDLINGRCEIELPYLLECPVGYKFHDDEKLCKRIIEVGTQFYCPVGFYDDGSACAQTIPAQSALRCDFGELIGDQCITKERAEYIIKAACPEGSELLKDGNCWKEIETFDCTEVPKEQPVNVLTAPREHTPLGKKVLVTKGKSGGRFRHLVGKEPIVEAPFVPPPPPKLIGAGKEMIAVSAPHPTMVSVVSQVCSKKVQIEALALISCPIDFVDAGGHCMKETLRSPITICTSGQRKDGVCVPMIKKVPKHPGCPKDSYSAENKCWKEDKRQPIESCPPTFIDTGAKCIGTVDEPGYVCPIGLELIGDKCFGQLVRPPLSFPTRVEPLSDGKKF